VHGDGGGGRPRARLRRVRVVQGRDEAVGRGALAQPPRGVEA
jgi:hypothetical protein